MCLETVDEGWQKLLLATKSLILMRRILMKRIAYASILKNVLKPLRASRDTLKIFTLLSGVIRCIPRLWSLRLWYWSPTCFQQECRLACRGPTGKKEAGYELILATEHAKHYNRVQGILQDVEANITMHPLNLDLHGVCWPSKQNSCIHRSPDI